MLWSDAGKPDSEIAQLLGVTPLTVAKTRQRWVKEKTLEDKPRPGRVKKLDGKQEAFLVALACSDAPDGYERWTMQLLADKLVELSVIDEPISDETWTMQLLADKLVELSVIDEPVSDETVRRTLKKTS